jgi:twitching motility protein PilT
MQINDLFELVAQENASDLLISAGAPPILRIHGQLFRSRTDALTPEGTEKLIFDFLTEEQREHFLAYKELDFSLASWAAPPLSRQRLSPEGRGDGGASGPIPEKIPSGGRPGPAGWRDRAFQDAAGTDPGDGADGPRQDDDAGGAHRPDQQHRACHIITVEDPIEYVHSHKRSIVDQREVGGDTNSFPTALKYVLRQDPDVIQIGEMRDLETIKAALTAAETGHLVFATLHTNDAIQTVDRIIDVFPGHEQQQIRFQLSMTLHSIISQRLLPNRTTRAGCWPARC